MRKKKKTMDETLRELHIEKTAKSTEEIESILQEKTGKIRELVESLGLDMVFTISDPEAKGIVTGSVITDKRAHEDKKRAFTLRANLLDATVKAFIMYDPGYLTYVLDGIKESGMVEFTTNRPDLFDEEEEPEDEEQ